MALRSSFDALAEHNFRRLFLARSVSLLGSAMAPIALTFAVLDDLAGSATDLGLVLAAASLPQVLLLLVGGVWADRVPRHRLLILTDVVMFAAQGTLALLLFAGAAELWHFLILQVVRGTAQAFFFPASTGLVPELVGAQKLQEANALLGLTANGSFLAGAAGGGVLVAVLGPAWAVAFDACTFLVSAGLLSGLRLGGEGRKEARNFLRELMDGWQEFSSRTWVWVPVLAAGVCNAIFIGSFLVLGPLVVDRELGGAAAWGLITAALGAGSLVGGLVMLRVRPRRPLFFGCATFVLVAPVLPLLAIGAPAPAIAAAAFLGGAGTEIYGTLWDTALQEHVSKGRISRVSAYDYVGSLVAVPVGLAVAGPVADRVGVDETLWAGGVVIVTAIIAQLFVREIRELPTTSSPAR